MKKFFLLLNGPNTVGNSPTAWGLFSFVLVAFLVYPIFGSSFMASNLALFTLYLPVALGLSLLWGYMGVLSFGQMAFFGISGYTYGILATNIQHLPGGSFLALAGGLCATALIAAFFGYFVFYGEVSDWIIPVLTLVLTLVMETFMAQTAGYQWRVGKALLGGYNGMTNIPSLRIGSLDFSGGTFTLYYLVVILCTLIYLGLRILVNSKWGSILVAIREDTARTRMVGHNVNLIQVLVFTFSAVLAGLSGIFYVSWGNYIDPSVMGLIYATLPVVWVCVGGRQSLLVVVMSTIILGYLSDILSVYGGEYAFLVNGALLLGAMVFFPRGIFLTLALKLKAKKRALKEFIRPEIKPVEKVTANKPLPSFAITPKLKEELILEAIKVSKAFGGVQAVSDLDFRMKYGELRSLIGPNGAGKSTFFNLLTGVYPPDKGEIIFKGKSIAEFASYQRVRSGISLKFQTTRTFQNLTVWENLQIPYYKSDHNSTNNGVLDWSLTTLGLRQYFDIPAKNLNHEHQQWLEICLALATEPELLLLDEPTTGMTPEETSRTAEFVKALNAMGMAILVVEHDMSFVKQIAGRVTILHQGSFFAEGNLAEIESNQEVRRIYLGD